MADIDLKTETPDTTLPTTGFLFGADSQAAASPSVFTVQSVATTLLGSTTLTGAPITADAPVLNMSQTWNNNAVTFTGLKFNATDTASASGSFLSDFQVGTNSKFAVRNYTSGPYIVLDGNKGWIGAKTVSTTNALVFSGVTNGADSAAITSFGFMVSSGAGIGFSAGSIGSNVTADTILTRRGERNLRFGAADAATALAQTLSVQSVVAGTTNTAGANLTITGSQGTGTGAGGSIIFQVAPAGSTGTAQNALATALTLTSNSALTLTNGQNTNTSSDSTLFTLTSTNRAAALNLNANSGRTGAVVFLSSGTERGRISYENSTDTLSFLVNTAEAFRITSSLNLQIVSGSNLNWNNDTILARDTTNTLAQRNGTNAQTFNIYNTFTTSTNFERFRIFAQSGGSVIIGTEKGSGGGTARALELQTDGTTRVTVTTLGSVVTNTAAIATTATDGFLYVPTCAGLPTGTPTTQTGTAPIVVDTTNNKLYFYSGGAWRDAGP